MKKLIFISFFLMISAQTFCQISYYVEKTEEGFEQPIIDKLMELGLKVTTKQENSTYTIKCLISKTGYPYGKVPTSSGVRIGAQLFGRNPPMLDIFVSGKRVSVSLSHANGST